MCGCGYVSSKTSLFVIEEQVLKTTTKPTPSYISHSSVRLSFTQSVIFNSFIRIKLLDPLSDWEFYLPGIHQIFIKPCVQLVTGNTAENKNRQGDRIFLYFQQKFIMLVVYVVTGITVFTVVQ